MGNWEPQEEAQPMNIGFAFLLTLTALVVASFLVIWYHHTNDKLDGEDESYVPAAAMRKPFCIEGDVCAPEGGGCYAADQRRLVCSSGYYRVMCVDGGECAKRPSSCTTAKNDTLFCDTVDGALVWQPIPYR